MRRLLLACVVLFGTPVAAAAPKLLVVGDSLSAAHGMAGTDGWVALLEDRLATRGFPHEVINASISGETSGGGLNRLPGLLERHDPAIVIIELGGNDGLRGLPLATLRDNLDAMVAGAREAGATVLVAGVRLPPNYGHHYTEAFTEVFETVAAEHGVVLVPRLLEDVDESRRLMQPDGIHPTAEAQPIMLDNLWPALEPLLEKTREAG
jgi:acyl-CoA thioesterase-1